MKLMYTDESLLLMRALGVIMTKNKCFSYTRNDCVVLLLVYNTSFCLWCIFLTDDRRIGVLSAFLILLIGLFVLTLGDMMQKKQEVKGEIRTEEKLIRKWINDEYKRVYAHKKKKELLAKAGFEENNTEIVLIEDQLEIKSCPNLTSMEKVHFAFLQKFSSNSSTNETTRNP